jgi:autotransporter translocation and assembly factor TamB
LWLVGTTSGGRLALSVLPGFLPETVEIEAGEFSGRLIDRFAMDGFALRLPTLELEAERVEFDWRAAGILRKRLHAYRVAVESLDVRLIEAPARLRRTENRCRIRFRLHPSPTSPWISRSIRSWWPE